MPAVERVVDRGVERARRAIIELGRELRAARITRALSQAVVARAAGISQSMLSEIERGLHLRVDAMTLYRVAAVVGLDLSFRAYPGGSPIRDKAHTELLERFRNAISALWSWAVEVPLPMRGDGRAWDRTIRNGEVVIGVEGETRLTDAQELTRRLLLKKRDGGIDRIVLVMPNSAWCRQFSARPELVATFPVPSRVALAALREGRDPGGDAVVLV